MGVSDEIRERAGKIRLVLMDSDGVLTDGRLYMFSDGSEGRAFNVRDGHGIRMAQRGGLMFGPYESGDDLELFGEHGVPEGFVGALLPPKLEPVESHIEAAVKMVPAFGEVGIRSNVRGPINLTPDGRPLVSPGAGPTGACSAGGSF